MNNIFNVKFYPVDNEDIYKVSILCVVLPSNNKDISFNMTDIEIERKDGSIIEIDENELWNSLYGEDGDSLEEAIQEAYCYQCL